MQIRETQIDQSDLSQRFDVCRSSLKVNLRQTILSLETTHIRVGQIEGLNGISRDVVTSLESIKQAIQNVSEYVTSTAAAVEEQSTVTCEMSSSMQRAADEARAIAAG